MSVSSMALHARDIPVLVGAAVTESDLAYGHLAGRDPVMRCLVRRFGQPEPFGRREEAGLGDNFSALVRYSILRTFRGRSTSPVYARIRRAIGGWHPSAAEIADLGANRLAALGMPAADADWLARIARAQLAGDVELDMLITRTDRQVREILGCYEVPRRVTDLFLIRRLHRPDVLPVDDPTLARTVRQVRDCGDADEAVGWRWAPFRTYAAALLWALSRELTTRIEQEGIDP